VILKYSEEGFWIKDKSVVVEYKSLKSEKISKKYQNNIKQLLNLLDEDNSKGIKLKTYKNLKKIKVKS